MNRNVEAHFSELPKVEISRSIFDRSSSHKTSFNVGELIPFYIDEVLPGDTFNITTSCVVRLQTPLTPIMDNIMLDTYFFFCPNRILWTHFVDMMGENKNSPWIPSVSYSVPYITPPTGGWDVGTIADYLGIPTGVYDSSHLMAKHPQALPFRAYAMCADTWFRDQNLSDPLNIPTGDSNVQGSNGSNYITDVALGGKPFKVAKFHDYFTSCLPTPQKGPSVGFLNNFFNMQGAKEVYIPVTTRTDQTNTTNTVPLFGYASGDSSNRHGVGYSGSGTEKPLQFNYQTAGQGFVPDNLWANVSNMNITINDMRIAFQMQKYYEKNARAGTRYREIIKEHFGVTTSDARMMIPEYLGGHRIPLSIHQVANAAASSGEYLGDVGAMSNTADVHSDFIRSFEEHGFVIGLCCVRYDHSYPQGLERFWCRSGKFDYYYPVFANIGEQPVFKHEIMWTDTTTGYEVFGYQEAWAEYRYKPSRVSGEMRPGITGSLATWHLSDYYSSVPSLSDSWIREDKANVDRVLSVSSSVSNQVFADFYVKNICTRPMPVYSVPGLIDHH